MYKILHELLKDHKSDITFNCFGIWHIIYILLVTLIITFVIIKLKNKSDESKKKAIKNTINIAVGLYILDFFLMPFAYQEIDLEKLPFHICTLTCVLCFLSRHTKFFAKYKFQFAILGFISNLVYFIYPAGVGWYQIHPLSYRVIQTLMFHAVMMFYGLLVIIFEIKELKWINSLKELVVMIIITIWALIGNTLYNGNIEGYKHTFNWLFVIQDPFYVLPSSIAPYIMPFIVVLAFYLVDLIVYLVYNMLIKKKAVA